MNNQLRQLESSLAINPPRIVFPEGSHPTIQQAAYTLQERKVIQPILLDENKDGDTLTKAAVMLAKGEAEAMVAGIDHPTKTILQVSLNTVGLAPETNYASSFFIMDIPHFIGGEAGLLLLADCGMNIQPSAEQLATIAITSAQTATRLSWQPRIAMLSYSTKGSASGENIKLIHQALDLVQSQKPGLLIDGELQLDAAIVPTIGQKKAPSSPVAGRANILIFPDLTSGNITYKAIKHFAGGHAYGPILQGFAKPIGDLSRGSSVEDVIGTSLLVASATIK